MLGAGEAWGRQAVPPTGPNGFEGRPCSVSKPSPRPCQASPGLRRQRRRVNRPIATHLAASLGRPTGGLRRGPSSNRTPWRATRPIEPLFSVSLRALWPTPSVHPPGPTCPTRDLSATREASAWAFASAWSLADRPAPRGRSRTTCGRPSPRPFFQSNTTASHSRATGSVRLRLSVLPWLRGCPPPGVHRAQPASRDTSHSTRYARSGPSPIGLAPLAQGLRLRNPPPLCA